MPTFASNEWAEALRARLQESARVRTESVTWVFGPIALLVDADAEHGVDATGLRIDVHEGTVRAVTVIEHAEAMRSPFAIGGTLARWKAAFGGTLSLVDGILDSKLRARGDLPTLARHRGLLDAIMAAGGEMDTAWQDETEPAAAAGAKA